MPALHCRGWIEVALIRGPDERRYSNWIAKRQCRSPKSPSPTLACKKLGYLEMKRVVGIANFEAILQSNVPYSRNWEGLRR